MAVRTGGEVLVASLQAAGVRHVFGIPGVQLDNLVDPLHDADDLQQPVLIEAPVGEFPSPWRLIHQPRTVRP